MNNRINDAVSCTRTFIGPNLPVAQVTMQMLIDFDLNSTDVKPQYHKKLARIASFLRENKTITAIIESQAINLPSTLALAHEISQRRAQSVVDYLIDVEDIHHSRLTAEGFIPEIHFTFGDIESQQENYRMNIIFNYT